MKPNNKITNPFGKPVDGGTNKKVTDPFGKPTTPDDFSNNNTNIVNTTYTNKTGLSKVPPTVDKIPPKKGNISSNQTTNDTRSEEINESSHNNTNMNKPMINQTFMQNSSNSGDNMREEMLKKEYEAIKQYNCNEVFLRPTVTKLPANVDTLKDSGVVIGLNINPLNSSVEIPVIKYNDDEEIPRCPTCKSYINPFLTWIEGGEKWICNMCKSKNVTLPYFYEALDKSGQRKDKGVRPEISNGSYEFYASRSFIGQDKPLMKPLFIFAIDVSLASSQSGYLTSVVEGIKQSIRDGIPYEENTKVAIITYDTAVHFYNLDANLTQPQMHQVNDSSIFLPIPLKFLLVNLKDSKDIILSTLDMIQTGFNSNTQREASKLIEVLDASAMIVNGIGGKIVVFHASHSIRENSQNLPQEELIYTTTDNRFLASKGFSFTEHNASVDLFVSAEQYINILTLNQICDYTSGNLHFFKKFRIDTHYKNLQARIRRTLNGKMELECVMRTRISGAFKISNFLTPVLISHGDLMRMSTLDEDSTFTVVLDFQQAKVQTQTKEGVHSGGLSQEVDLDPFIYIQSALLFTHQDGTRRVRIHNLCLSTTNKVSELHDSIDCDALSSLYLKLLVDKIFKSKKIVNSILSVENLLKSLITSVFASMHTHTKELPNNLEYLPLYFCGMLKNRICCKDEIGLKLDIDTSNYIRIKLLRMNVNEIINFIYPKFFQIHHLELDPRLGTSDSELGVILPEITTSHSKSLENDGVYLVDNGFAFILYVKLHTSKTLLQSLFEVDSLTDIKTAVTENNLFNNDPLNQRLLNIVEYLRQSKTFYQSVLVVFETTDSERLIKECLIEDNLCPWIKFDFQTYRQNIISESTSLSSRGMKSMG